MKSIKELKKVFQGKKVLITGHTGFKGSWLTLVLNYLGAEIIGASIDCKTKKRSYRKSQKQKNKK